MSLAAAIVWEVRQATGADTNGGGFKAGASGTDWSQQAAAQYSVTDGVTAGTTTITSATAAFGTDVVGNVIYVQGGTGAVTAGWYEIISRTNATTIVVDRSTGLTAGTGVTLKIGGALASLTKAGAVVVAGNKVYAKGTFGETLTLTIDGTGALPIVWEGYGTARGDGSRSNQAIVEGGNTRANCLSLAGITYNTFKYFTFQGATTKTVLWTVTPDYTVFFVCRVLKGTGTAPASFGRTGYGRPIIDLIGCEVSGCTGDGVSLCSWYIDRCEVHGNTANAVSIEAYRVARGLTNSLIYDNGGDGVNMPASAALYVISGNTFDGNTGDAIEINGAGNATVSISNNIFEHSGGYNINVANAPSGTTTVTTVKNFYLAGSSGHVNNAARLTALEADVQLTGDALTNVGGDDFSLDSTTGEGAAIRAAAFGNVFPSGNTTSYRDGGAVQHADAGGGGTIVVTSTQNHSFSRLAPVPY